MRRAFRPRPCLICEKMMLSIDEIEFLRPTEAEYPNDGANTDYTGYCKSHDISDLLYKKNGKYHLRNLSRVSPSGSRVVSFLRRLFS